MKALPYILFLCFYFSGHAQIAKVLDTLFAQERTLDDTPEKVRVLILIGAHQSKTAPEAAQTYFHKALRLGKRLNEKSYVVSAYSQLAILHNNGGKADSTDYYIHLAQQNALAANQNRAWANFHQASELINRSRGNYTTALTHAKNFLKYTKLLGEKPSIAGAYLNLGNCQYELKQFKPAIENFFNALKIFEEANNTGGKAFCYTNIGMLYKEIGQYSESLKYAKMGFDLKEKLGDEKGLATSYQLMAENYMNLRQYKKSLDLIDKSIQINQKLKLTQLLTRDYWIKGRIYSKQKDTLNAIKLMTLALEEGKNLNAPVLLKEIQTELEQLQQVPIIPISEPLKNRTALLQARAKNDTADILKQLEELSVYFYKQGDYKQAYDYREEYQQLRRYVYSPEILKNLKEMEGRFELQKKESAIKLLEKDTLLKERKIQNQKAAIYAALGTFLALLFIGYLLISRNKIVNEKKRTESLDVLRKNIAKDLHDDLGSTLSSIQIMANLVFQQTDNHPQIHKTVGHIAELSHKVASGMKEIVWSVNPEHDKLEFVAAQMRKITAEMLEGKNCRFSFINQIPEPKLEINPVMRKDLFLILKESLNNALKYSETPFIDVLFSQTRESLTLEVKDFGKGFDMKTVQRGNGLNNIQKRVENSGGKWVIESTPGEGTLVHAEIPIV